MGLPYPTLILVVETLPQQHRLFAQNLILLLLYTAFGSLQVMERPPKVPESQRRTFSGLLLLHLLLRSGVATITHARRTHVRNNIFAKKVAKTSDLLQGLQIKENLRVKSAYIYG